jgi:hypothetical protein
VGSWVREEAMRTLYLLIKLVAESHIYETWADVIKDQQTLKVLVKSIASELMA